MIYREWFVNFRFPGHEEVPMVDSQLGQIPEGWRVSRLGDVLELCYGRALKEADRRGGHIPVFGSSGVVGYHDEALATGPGIIVGRKGNVGSVHWSDSDFYAIDTVYFVKTDLPLHYVFYNLQSQNFINSDAAVPGLSRAQAYSLQFLVASQPIMELFADYAVGLFAAISNLRHRNKNFHETRELLLPRLMSGEIDVSDLDIHGLETITDVNRSAETAEVKQP